MSLQYKFFIIPTADSAEAESELNRFLRSVRVITIHREFVANGQNIFWSMAVEYLSDGIHPESNQSAASGKKKVDYRDVLSSENFAIFAKLRDWRKIAAAQEQIPMYMILTNEQLAKIAENRIITEAALREIEGIGDARVKKYGEAVLKIVSEFLENKGSENEAERQSVSSDSNA
jgi:superfamily II DNA helicase RecQ